MFYPERSKHQILVASTGRSGTRYMASVLKALGLRVNHESVGQDGIVAFFLAGRDPHWMSKIRQYASPVWFHQVREPLNVIRSWTEIIADQRPQNRVKRNIDHLPEISLRDDAFVKAVKYWYYWNRCCETFDIVKRYKIEELATELPSICEIIGLPFGEEEKGKLQDISYDLRTDINPVTWEKISNAVPKRLFESCQRMAAKYGYL